MFDKILINISSIVAIWGLSLSQLDLLVKIICTISITSVSIYVTLRKKKK